MAEWFFYMGESAPRLGWDRLSSAQLVYKCHCQCVQKSSDVFMELNDSLFRFLGGYSFVDRKRAVIAVFYSHMTH